MALGEEIPETDPVEVMSRLRQIAGEFFDHAIILTSRDYNGETEFYHTKLGNQFALKGMAEVFMDMNEGILSSPEADEEYDEDA